MARECKEHEITLNQFLKFVHGYTERVAIKVVGDAEAFEDKVKEFYLTENAFKDSRDCEERLLKYYEDTPLWNLHVEYEYIHTVEKGHFLTGVLVANCHYADIREGYLLEKEDKRKAKRKAYRERRKTENTYVS